MAGQLNVVATHDRGVDQRLAIVADGQVRRDVAATYRSKPPWATNLAKVNSSRVGTSSPLRV